MTTAVLPFADPGSRPARFGDAVRSEWTKIRTVPATFWTVVIATVLGVGLGALISAVASNHYAASSASERATWDPTSISGAGLGLAQLAIAVLGILFITSEYSSKAISTSLMAVPRRTRFLAAKTVVVAAVSLVVAEVLAFVTFFIGQALMSGHAPTATLGQHEVLRALIGIGLYAALIGVLGLGLGVLLRSAAGAIAVMVALLYVLPGVAAALPSSIEHTVEEWWPTQAGGQITNVVRGSHTLSPWAGLAVLCVFTALVLAGGFLTLNRRDA
jgi:ABC-2 type transport system permease protein